MQQGTPVVHNSAAVGHRPLTNLDLAQAMIELESKLLASLREVIKKTIKSLRDHIAAERHACRKEIESLTMRVTALESDKMAGESVHHINHSLALDSSPPPRAEEMVELESMVKSLTSKHEKMERDKERERRKCKC